MNRRFQYAVVASSACIVGVLLFGTGTVRSATPDDAPYTQLAVFSDVLSKIKTEYVEDPDLKAVAVGAVNGLLEELDPFASYLNAEQYKQYQAEHGKGKADVGIYLSRGRGFLRIVDTLPGSAADKAGLATNDVLESINNISTRDMPLAFAEMLLQGEPGTTVEVSALTARQSDPINLKLTRAPLAYPSVTSKMTTDKQGQQVGMITVGALLEGRSKEIAQKVQDLEKQGAKRLILDLRNSVAGPVEEGVAVADLFMDSGVITYSQGQKQRRTDSTASATNTVTKLPLTVLTNRGTAGAAEVTAAALQDSKRATVIGEVTFGAAAVRRPVTLPEGGAIILAVAKYYSPNGKSIQDDKVTPSVLQAQVEIAANPDETKAPASQDKGKGAPRPGSKPEIMPTDTILDKALESISQNQAK
jgi:carboxyl-terminal processing protease